MMSEKTDWWRGGVIYQIYPRSFQDTSGDGSGDLRGIARRLEHVASLGVDAIWISPFFTSPMKDMGYDVSDYRDVDPLFGTLADFDAVIAEAHRLGLKVIIDQVLSHSSDQHAWFVESRSSRANPKADWYVWADSKPDGSPPNNWISVFGGSAWEWDAVRRQFYLHNFLASQPDLNFHNPDVQDALLHAVRFWLQRGVDGFRLDTVNYYFHDVMLRDNAAIDRDTAGETNPYAFQDHVFDKNRPENIGFLRRFRALLDEYGAVAVGEVGEGDGAKSLTTVAAYTSGGDKLHMCYTFDMLGPKFTPGHFASCIRAFETSVTDGWVCWAFSNHDVVRHVSRWTPPDGDIHRVARLAISLLAALRGSVCIYQGEELALTEAELRFEDLQDPYGIRFWPGFKGRDGCRTPMVWDADRPAAGFSDAKPWLPVPPDHAERAVSVQQDDPASTLAAYRDVVAFRNAHAALVEGAVEIVAETDSVLALRRWTDDEEILCVFNLSAEPVNWALPEGTGNAEAIGPLDFGAARRGATIDLPRFSAWFARL